MVLLQTNETQDSLEIFPLSANEIESLAANARKGDPEVRDTSHRVPDLLGS